jgi:hypothetical protein
LLVVDPARRLSPAEALMHPWVVEGLADVDGPPPPPVAQEAVAQGGAYRQGQGLPPIQSERGEQV